jgi:hypothetical protein
MNNLTLLIDKNITTEIEKFIGIVSVKYKLSSSDLLSLWKNLQQSENIETQDLNSPIIKESPHTNSTTHKSPQIDHKSSNEQKVCTYVFAKGAKEGEICGSKVRGECAFCSKHKKYEGVDIKEKKIMPQSKKTFIPAQKRKPAKGGSTELILRKHKILDKLWHVETGMVFKSARERLVIGKCVDDKVQELTGEDLELCRTMGFAYEESFEYKNLQEPKDNSSDLDIEEQIDESSKLCSPGLKYASAKKSITGQIAATNKKALDIEKVLTELQLPSGYSHSISDEDELEDELDEELEDEEEGLSSYY